MIRTFLILLATSAVVLAEAKKPNIVLIFADDLGWKDVGFQGSDFFETPNLDALAKKSMVFTQAYAGAGNCAPSRACLLSGNYTPRHGVYAVGSTDRGPKSLMRLNPIPNTGGLAKANVTIADALKDAGYATGIFGKWHLFGKGGGPPKDQGFDAVFDSFGEGEETGEANKKGPPTDPKGVFTLTRKACEFITANKDKPFFCYIPHHAVHTPLQGQAESLRKFQAKPAGKQHSNAVYAACLYDLDEAVGRVLKTLKDNGLEKNTLVLFTSDNGGTTASQEPLRGAKGCYYEGGIREPFIAHWPGVITPGTTCDVPVHNVDLFPTFLAAAGVPVPKGKTLDGESLLPLFQRGEGLKREAIFWHFPGYLDNPVPRGRDKVFRTRPVSVIRKGDWKLHLNLEEWHLDGGRDKLATNKAAELYNIRDDIGERNDLANTNTAKRDELLNDLLAWHKSVDAKLPTVPSPDYKPDALVTPKKKGKNKP